MILFAFHRVVNAEFDEIDIVFFYGTDVLQFELYSISSIDDINSHRDFNRSRKTVLYIHGFRENSSSESVETVVKAFIKRQSHNILVLDWSAYVNGNYATEAVPNLIRVVKH